MRVALLDQLRCPNSGCIGFTCFATKLRRDQRLMVGISHDELHANDEVLDGLLVSQSEFVWPIRHGVLSLLADADVCVREYTEHFEEILPECPSPLVDRVMANLARLEGQVNSSDGDWNRDEMAYYDVDVDSPEKRSAMVDDIHTVYLPHIYLPRTECVIDPLKTEIAGKTVVEIGCGNARTITRMMSPSVHFYQYIGTDISFWRLVVAKQACPDGEFIQASALNLPLQNNSADIGISFGMLHHLPRPADGLRELIRVLESQARLAIHEPIKTGKFFEGFLARIGNTLQTYAHSERDGEVDFQELLRVLKEHDFQVIMRRWLATPFRTIVEVSLNRLSSRILRSPSVYRVMLSVDRICAATICRAWKMLSPRGVIVLLERRS